jgi:hypothetical protein
VRTGEEMRDIEGTRRDGWFVTAAETIGDLDNPFYDEERQRDVWNMASAIGLQVALWLGNAAAAGMTWIDGAEALPYAAAMLVVVASASAVTMAYAARLGVRFDDTARVLRLRLIPFGALWMVFLAGAVRTAPDGGFAGGFARGAAPGRRAAAASGARRQSVPHGLSITKRQVPSPCRRRTSAFFAARCTGSPSGAVPSKDQTPMTSARSPTSSTRVTSRSSVPFIEMKPVRASRTPGVPCARLPGCCAKAASLSYSGMRLSSVPELIPVTIDSSTCTGVAVDKAVLLSGVGAFAVGYSSHGDV